MFCSALHLAFLYIVLDPVVCLRVLALAGPTVSLGCENGAQRPLVPALLLHPHQRAVEGCPGTDGPSPTNAGQIPAGRRSRHRGRCVLHPQEDGGYGEARPCVGALRMPVLPASGGYFRRLASGEQRVFNSQTV